MTLLFTAFVAGWLAAWSSYDVLTHSYGFAVFNLGFSLVAASIAWSERP